MRARALSELLRSVADRVVLAKQTFLSRAAKFDGIYTVHFSIPVGERSIVTSMSVCVSVREHISRSTRPIPSLN